MAINVWLIKPRACAAFSGGEGKVRSLRDLSLIVSSSISAGVFSAIAEPIPASCLEPPGELEALPPPLPPRLPLGGPLSLRRLAVSLGQSFSWCFRLPHMRHAGLSSSSLDDELLEELDGDPGGPAPEPSSGAPQHNRNAGTVPLSLP